VGAKVRDGTEAVRDSGGSHIFHLAYNPLGRPARPLFVKRLPAGLAELIAVELTVM
jgi:hypothetical protein